MKATATWELEMLSVSTAVGHAFSAGVKAGLSREAAALGALIGVLSVIRVEGLPEAKILREAQKATPTKLPQT